LSCPHDEAGNTWHYSDQQLFDLTKHGVSSLACGDYKTRMPAYAETLSDREIFAVLSYIKSQWPKRIRQRHDRLNAAARQAHSD
jgi:mono/diheme cytochrome c family protein